MSQDSNLKPQLLELALGDLNNKIADDILDISNIIIYGDMAFNYSIVSTSTISGIISKRYLYTIGKFSFTISSII